MKADSLNRCVAEVHSETVSTVHHIGLDGQDKGTVLVVEDEQSIGLSLRLILSGFRLVFIQATLSEEGVSILRSAHFDAALLNINKPGTRGTEVCRGIRKHQPRLPILMLGAANDEDQELASFEAGADDYIAKPFRDRALIARLEAAIRRGRLCTASGTVITVGDLSLDSSRRLAKKNGRPIHLTPKQFKLASLSSDKPRKGASSCKAVDERVGAEYGGELEYLRAFVRQLRKKLEDDPARPRYLLTESHFGYRLNELA